MATTTMVPTLLPKTMMTMVLALGTLKAMAVTDTWVPNQDTLDYVNDVTNEAAGTNYVAGGLTLTTPVVNVDTATNKATLDADNIATAGLSVSCRYWVVYVATGTPSTSPVLAVVDLLGGVGSGNVTCTGLNWDALGILPAVVA